VAERSSVLIIRLPRLSYVVVGFLVVGLAPIALYGGYEHPTQARISALTLLYVIPVLAAFFIARSATIVGTDGIGIRAVFGRRMLRWDDIRGLSVDGRNIYALLLDGGAVISRASGDRLPEIPEARVIAAPGRRAR
jgi:hypothetical protein